MLKVSAHQPKNLNIFLIILLAVLINLQTGSSFVASTPRKNVLLATAGLNKGTNNRLFSARSSPSKLPSLCMQVPGLGDASMSLSSIIGGLSLVPVASGLETVLALVAGHVPGVVVGALTLGWSLFLKDNDQVKELLPFSTEAVATPLSIWVGLLLGVRLATLSPDGRYASFPDDIAAPIGCTRVASDFSSSNAKNLAVPKIKGASVEEVQKDIKGWIKSQPRSTIIAEEEGYIHAQVLSNLMGFPDNLGVKVFKNKAGEVEVWAQGELRVGQGDLGVNYNRVSALLKFLNSTSEKTK